MKLSVYCEFTQIVSTLKLDTTFFDLDIKNDKGSKNVKELSIIGITIQMNVGRKRSFFIDANDITKHDV